MAAALSDDGALEPEPVLCRVSAGVATVTLNRPDRLNAWTPAMERGWFEVLDALVVDPGVRAVVLTGAGRGFCAGLDAEHIARRSAGAEAAPPRTRPLSGLAAFPKPVVAAVNGPAVGLGLALALCCDAGRAEFREGGSALRGRRAPEFPPLGPDHPDVREWLRPVD